ncbi:uncharacterized protein N7473_008302 [Penicillium subrubescens]|uniref:Uncharacterized protein n=1 Tax=Penicillium subrubescens TaxID=1316194 RepID=A0A1Q5TH71_9EURO|nr:uncharacterized protein N7473_008302 [Penicillium subrubescens]KAJ5892074.1 hypothetical protein N7473_008302 [Penicillium subrubescens]OKO99549.1 hypothetical protein PENSUB_8394 [Penicillium subrubescens]
MASLLGSKSMVQPCILLIVLVMLQRASAQMCSFWESGCIDPLAQTAVPMDFSPLFPDPITFYYAFDELSSGKGKGPMTKTSYWLRYHDRKINKDQVTSNRTSEVALRVGNLTGTPSGTTNGCDGIWGNPCSQDIKGALQHTIFRLATSGEYYSKPLEASLALMMVYPPHLPNCGAPIFDVASIPVQDFAKERIPGPNVTVMPPGSSNRPWQVLYIDGMTSHQQASQVAVGIIARSPTYNSPPPLTPDEIQVELVCLQAPQGPPVGPSKGS